MATGAAASDFGYERASRHERLLSDLVYAHTKLEPGDETHEALLDHCLRTTKYHRFADPDPRQIDRLYDDLGERMDSLAQFGKQRALAALLRGVEAIELHSDTLEVNHRILCLLYYCSRSPLNVAFRGTALTEELLAAGRPEAEQLEELLAAVRQQDVADQGSSLSRSSSTPPSSSSSGWTESEDDESIQQGTDTILADRNELETGKAGQQGAGDWGKAAKPVLPHCLQLKPVGSTVALALPGSLYHAITDPKFRDILFAQLPAASCLPQPAICAQVISMFRGNRYPGEAFVWRSALGSFEVGRYIHTPQMSLGALRSVLEDFAEAGSVAARLWSVVEGTQIGHLQEHLVTSVPSWTAFVVAIGKQLQSINEHLISVERGHELSSTPASLLDLRHALRGPVRLLKLLDLVFAEAVSSQKHDNAWERSASLLTKLHSLLKSASLQVGLQGESQSACLLRLLCGALRPTLEALDAWLGNGRLPASHAEFFIYRDEDVPPEAKDFWERAYRLRDNGEGLQCCPDFLLPVAEEVLDSGRALIMMRQQQQQQQEHDLSEISTPQGAGHTQQGTSLYVGLLKALKDVIKVKGSEALLEASAAEGPFLEAAALDPIGDRMAKSARWHLARPDHLFSLDSAASELQLHSNDLPNCCEPAELPGKQGPFLFWRQPVLSSAEEQSTAPDQMDRRHADLGQISQEAAWSDEPVMQQRLNRVSTAMECPERWETSSLSADGPSSTELSCRYRHQDPADPSGPLGEGLALQSWLDSLTAVDLPPCQSLLRTCLMGSLASRVQHTAQELLSALLGPWALRQQLHSLRNLYLGGSPALLPFAYGLVEGLLGGRELPDCSALELREALQECLDSVRVDLDQHRSILESLRAAEARRKARAAPTAGSTSFGALPDMSEELPRTLVEMKALHLDIWLPWPLSLVVDAKALRLYNAVLVFLMQLRWAQEAVRAGQAVGGRNQPFSPLQPLGHKLLHLVTSLEHYAMGAVAAAWQTLQQAESLYSNWLLCKELDSAGSLHAARAAHMRFLEAAAQPCMASSEGSWNVIYSVLRKLLDTCLRFHDLAPVVQDALTADEGLRALARLSAEFADRHRYLLKSLTAKSLKIGDKSGLQHLVMLLNYNGYYQ